MKKARPLLLIIPIAFILSSALKKAPATQEKYAETITAEDLRKHLSILASDEYEGRETGEKGQKMAAEYISGFFKNIGIPAQANGTWYQNAQLVKISGGTSSFIAADSLAVNVQFDTDDYFYASSTPGTNIVTNDFVFAGYGIDDEKYSDYAQHEPSYYAGKVLIILEGEPSNNGVFKISGNKNSSVWTKQRRAKLNAAKKYNVKALLVVPAEFAKTKEFAKHSIEGYSLLLDQPAIAEDAPVPVIYVKDSLANTIFALANGTTKTYKDYIAELRQSINTTGVSKTALLKTYGNITITRKEEKLITENVLGYVEGTDLKDQLIVVTAHYDHLGKHDGVIYNGADDDGSGTVAVMELAEAFMKAKQDGHGPRRSMLFMTVSGEEKGLLGSAWYASHPVYPLEKTMCDLNIDMIGRVDEEHKNDSNFVYVIGSDKLSKDLKKITEAANKKYCKLKLDYRYDDPNDPNMFYYRSDHYNFAKNGIPVAFFFNGVHADYHKETDEISKINFSLMQKRTRLVFHTAWELANRDKSIKLNPVKK